MKLRTKARILFLAVCAMSTMMSRSFGAGHLDRLVVITDSHGILTFGQGIETWLQNRAATQYDFFAAGGTEPRHWLSVRNPLDCSYHDSSAIIPANKAPRACYKLMTPFLSELWTQQGPRLPDERRITVIAHGTNFPMTDRASRVDQTRALIQVAFAQSDQCIWIGPPNMTRSPGYDAAAVTYKYGIIEEAIDAAQKLSGKRCMLIDSRPLSTYPKNGFDGIHYQWPKSSATKAEKIAGREDAEKWTAGVVSKLEEYLQ